MKTNTEIVKELERCITCYKNVINVLKKILDTVEVGSKDYRAICSTISEYEIIIGAYEKLLYFINN